MKIAYITPSGIPSKEANTIQVMKMCEAFSMQGHSVKLFCSTNTSQTVTDVFDYYGLSSEFGIERLPWKPLKGYQFSVLAALKARRFDADIIYARSIAGSYFSALLGLDVILEAHVPLDDRHPITDRMFTSLIQHSNFVSLVVITDSLRSYYDDRYELGDKLQVAHDAATRQDGTPIEEIQQRAGQQVGYVGHLYEGKGIELIIELATEVPEDTFHVVGGTKEDVNYWKTQTTDIENVVFHGHVPPANVEDYLASFDTVLAPYQTTVKGAGGDADLSRWMSPLKIFEYMSAGKPIVCSDLPVLREVLVDGENALLCAPENVSEWAAALRTLRADSQLQETLIQNAQSDFETQYSYSARSKFILDSYK